MGRREQRSRHWEQLEGRRSCSGEALRVQLNNTPFSGSVISDPGTRSRVWLGEPSGSGSCYI